MTKNGKEEASYVVVFPSIFAKRRMRRLAADIKTVLQIRDQRFKSVVRDGDIIRVHANDPVFASSAIGLLFGVGRVAIARRTDNGFDELVSKIASVGGNLLLKGERFLVRVDGTTRGFTPKDAEIAATSKIIEKRELGAIPGTERRFDKELYTYVTGRNAYVCIFSDGAMWGVPREPGQDKTVCAIYDELSALSCFECMRQGYDVRIVTFYRRRPELLNLARMLSRIIPRMLSREVELEFVRMKEGVPGGGPGGGGRAYLAYVDAITETVLSRCGADGNCSRISLAVPPAIFPAGVVDSYLERAFRRGMIPLVPLAGSGAGMYEIAREVGLGEAGIRRLERKIGAASATAAVQAADRTDAAVQAADAQKITIRVGANNVHDILDALYPAPAPAPPR